MIKRFVTETGSAIVDRLIAGDRSVATATITYAELYAGLTRKYRQGNASQADYGQACAQIEAEWQAYYLVELEQDILQLARDLIQRHTLRGFDAIHLASALSMKARLEEEMLFLASDRKLLRAAAIERLKILDVERAPPV